MAVTGTLTVDLNNYSTIVNDASRLGAGVTTGIADQGTLIGQVWGVVIAIGSLLGLITAAFLIFTYLAHKAGGVGKTIGSGIGMKAMK